MEWFFLVIATVTLLGLLGFSIERLISVKNTFENFTEVDDGGLMYPSSVELPGVQEVGWMVEDGNGTDGTGGSDCNQWTCLNDFIFALFLLVNMGEFVSLQYSVCVCTSTYVRCSHCTCTSLDSIIGLEIEAKYVREVSIGFSQFNRS